MMRDGQWVWGTKYVPQKLKQNVKLVYNFYIFLYKILDFMNIRAGLGEYILHTHNTKFYLKIEWGGVVEHPNPPALGTPVDKCD